MPSLYGRKLRKLNTIVCVALFALTGANTALAEGGLHPRLGVKPPRDTYNRDLMALPEAERQAWIHGAMTQMAQVLASKDADSGKCVMNWYFETGNGSALIPQAIAKYPNERATSTIMAVTRLACPSV